jgi:hypothetical protein
MPDINDIVEESAIDRFYVFRGHRDARAIELVYDGNRWVFDEPTKEQSLVKAKLALRAYRAFHGLDGQFWPDYRYATMTPVFAETRDAELRVIAEIDAVRFAPARLQ